ncbi:unnamed protein product, partial [Amoebophrya sp. A25]
PALISFLFFFGSVLICLIVVFFLRLQQEKRRIGGIGFGGGDVNQNSRFHGRVRCWFGTWMLALIYCFFGYNQILMVLLCYTIMNARELHTFLDFLAQLPFGNPKLLPITNGFFGLNLCASHADFEHPKDVSPDNGETFTKIHFWPDEPASCGSSGEISSDTHAYFRHLQVMNIYWGVALFTLMLWLRYGKVLKNMLCYKPGSLKECTNVLIGSGGIEPGGSGESSSVLDTTTTVDKKMTLSQLWKFYLEAECVEVHLVLHDQSDDQSAHKAKVRYLVHDSTRFVYSTETETFVDPQSYPKGG